MFIAEGYLVSERPHEYRQEEPTGSARGQPRLDGQQRRLTTLRSELAGRVIQGRERIWAKAVSQWPTYRERPR